MKNHQTIETALPCCSKIRIMSQPKLPIHRYAQMIGVGVPKMKIKTALRFNFS